MAISDAPRLIKESVSGFKLLGPWKQVLDQVDGARLFDANVELRHIFVH